MQADEQAKVTGKETKKEGKIISGSQMFEKYKP